MARYLFTVWSFPGHLNPSIAVANALQARGHDVAFYTGLRAAELVTGLGMTFFPMRHVDEETLYRILTLGDDDGVGRAASPADVRRLHAAYRAFVLDPVPGQLADLEPILTNWQPDVIVCDPNLLAPFLVLHETRSAAVAMLSHAMACTLSGPDVGPWGRALPPPTTWRRRLRANLEKTVARLFIRGFQDTANALRARYDLAPLSAWIGDYAGTMPLYLIASVPEMDYNRTDLPPQAHYIGRLTWDRSPNQQPPSWLNALPSDKPLVYVTEGTVHSRQPRLLQAAARALAGLPLHAILTLTPDRDPEAVGLGSLPPNIHVKTQTPGQGWQSDVIARASLVITNGGAGSVLGALSAGVPLIVAPTAWDKPENAQRVVEAGAGVCIPPRHCTPERLRSAVKQVLSEPSFGANARRLAGILARYDGPARAAELLESLCAADEPPAQTVLAGRPP